MNDADHEAMGAMLYVGSRQGRDYHREMVEKLRAQNAKLREALKLLLADVQDYETWQRPCYAVDVASAVLAETE